MSPPADRRGPHLLGEDDALEHGPHVGFGALEVMNDQPGPDVAIKGVVGERRGLLQQARGVPVVMLDEAVGEIHGRCPRLARQQQAAGRVEVDAVRGGEPEVARLVWRTGSAGRREPGVKARENASMAS